MKRTILIAIALLVALMLVVEFVPIYKKLWIGGYDLTIHVNSREDLPRSILCYAVFSRSDAESIRAALPPADSLGPPNSALADPFNGHPLIVQITTGGSDSAFGRELSRIQHRYLVVIAEWPDGRRSGKVVEIPDGRISREVHLSIP